MKIAILSPIAWRTPPRNYGPWEQVASTICEGLIKSGIEVSLFATGDSITSGTLKWVCERGYAEDPAIDPKVWESLHISNLMEQAGEFDLIHNHFDFLPLTYSSLIKTPILTTIHGFSSPKILPVYQRYNANTHYISISDADRHPSLNYLRTIHHGINPEDFPYCEEKEDYLLYFGRIHPDKGTHTAIEIARLSGSKLKIAGFIQDKEYFDARVGPHLDSGKVEYVGNADPESRKQLLGKAKALLHPIYFDEPFGLSVVEAMMCGTPVIAFNRGSMPELILNGTTGFLVNTVEEAIKAAESLHLISPENCRKHALRNFSTGRMIENYLEAYREILRSR
ncbi:glycosyltransferase family 4 protein [Zunongwangia sp. F260]|uniref:Glycosyltransferase family 4 protein n=1 Tax=Autumnicola lenta TaxID=3075593 RepID=A0ABU3CIW5_9FLAO|nr:glycosyltransferase family 4 protein [Zunongwangia sp. F260]MDT0646297.1 glycosyltransferase family 4 protein [Zunongwangia sp. F260]